ncbi:MAG: tryptophan--tRNA ligase [Nannocystaceae bacterium]|nr:tryptophan--tRNA ligase [Nannocystaceae bacterium]
MADNASSKPRLLTGDRPTGPLHLGHLVGSLEARVESQDTHECFIIVADLHTLTTRPQKQFLDDLPRNVRDVVLDLVSAGIDPAKATIYLQSGVPAVYDLSVFLSMLIPKRRLEQIKSLKAMAVAAQLTEDAMTLGLLAYPVLQAADILMARATLVPVGQDIEEHIDVARELAMVFNDLYGEVFPLPQAKLSRTPILPGVNVGVGGTGTKMSKSLGNAIYLKDSKVDVADKLRTIDPDEKHADGQSPLLAYARAFCAPEAAADLARDFDAGKVTGSALHDAVLQSIEARLEPIRQRRSELDSETGLVEEILVDGTIRARTVANRTLQDVRTAMGFESMWSAFVDATSERAKARKRPY